MKSDFIVAASAFAAFFSLSVGALSAQNIALSEGNLQNDKETNCYLSLTPEMELEGFFERSQAGEDLPYAYTNPKLLNFSQESLPRIVVNKDDGLVQVFLDTAAVEAERFTVNRVTRPDEVVSVDAGSLSEALVSIDLRADTITLQRLGSGEEFIHDVDRSKMYLKQGIGAQDVQYDFEIGGLIADIRASVDHVKFPNFTIMFQEPTDNFDEFSAHLLIGLGENGVSATFWDGVQFEGGVPDSGYISKVHCRTVNESAPATYDVNGFRPH